ncbi:DNA polymerase IV [Syntrophomonas erecta]
MDIIHCDLDAFYASVEQRDNPQLRGKPVIVGALPGQRGVVSTCSYEAREYGIHSAMPINQAYRLCPQAIFLPPRMEHYQKVSRQVFSIFEDFTPIWEALSIDEAFLDVSGCHRLFGSSRHIASLIRSRVLDETGLTISVGIGPNKFLAKLATNMAKPDGMMEFTSTMISTVLPGLPVTCLWGIGEKTAGRLRQLGIDTVGSLFFIPRSKLTDVFGSNTDFYLDLARGIDRRPVVSGTNIKSISNETTFGNDLADPSLIRSAIMELSHKVGLRLRREGLKARTIMLKLRTSDFKTLHRRQTMDSPTETDLEIFTTAYNMYDHSGLKKVPLRLVGVGLSGLTCEGLEQPALFNNTDGKIDHLLDNLQLRFEGAVITRAVRLKSPETDKP